MIAPRCISVCSRSIRNWRHDWGRPDLSFYWVQLANFKASKEAPGDDDWAELREAQSLTLAEPHTGEAVIIDLGMASDIHPTNKRDVADVPDAILTATQWQFYDSPTKAAIMAMGMG